jgi:tetratricopeptide (TPR) repeat protein
VRAISTLSLLALAALLAGCQTDKRGVQVDLGAALRAYRERLDREPSRAEAERLVAGLGAEQLNDLGVLYEREGRLDRATWAYQHAIWRNPRFAPAYVNLGNVLRQQGKAEEALSRYRQAMNADPASFDAANNFADLCGEKGVHLEEAAARLTPLVQAPGPHRAYGLDTLGWLYHLQGSETRAAAVLEAALRDSTSQEPALRLAIHEHLAVVYGAMGRVAEAGEQQAAARRMKAEQR